MWVGKFALLGSGEPEWIDNGTTTVSGAASLNGAAYDPEFDALYVTTEAVAAADTYIGGFRYRSDGALRVYDATSAVPAGSNTNQGIALTSDGQLCYATTASTAFNLNGVAVDTLRRVYAAPLAFALEFADLGAGVVSTVEAITAATPTFTRATTATTVLSTGLIGAVASGDPRSYYDPTSLAYLGYLAEGARTNICLQSEVLGTTWTNVNSADSANAGVAPDGASTADKLIPDAAATDGAMLQTGLTLSAAATYTFSVFAKTSGFDSLQLRIGDLGFTNSASVTYNTTTGAVESAAAVAGTWTATSSTAKQYPSGWWRFTLTATATTNAGDRCTLVNTDTGDAANGVLLWGMQIEAAAFASSYIPTTTLAVVRNADVLTYPASGIVIGTAGSIFAEISQNWTGSQNAGAAIIELDSVGNRPAPYIGTGRTLSIFDGTTDSVDLNFTPSSSIQKIGCSYGGTTMKTFAGGVAGAGDPFDGDINVGTNIGIGFRGAGQFAYGPIRRVSYYAARLADATLQGFTT